MAAEKVRASFRGAPRARRRRAWTRFWRRPGMTTESFSASRCHLGGGTRAARSAADYFFDLPGRRTAELSRPAEQASFSPGPFCRRCRWVGQAIDFPSRHGRGPGSRTFAGAGARAGHRQAEPREPQDRRRARRLVTLSLAPGIDGRQKRLTAVQADARALPDRARRPPALCLLRHAAPSTEFGAARRQWRPTYGSRSTR